MRVAVGWSMTNGGGDRWAEGIELAVQYAVCAGKVISGVADLTVLLYYTY